MEIYSMLNNVLITVKNLKEINTQCQESVHEFFFAQSEIKKNGPKTRIN